MFEVILTQIRMKFCVQIGRRTSSVGQENDKIQYTFYRVVWPVAINAGERKTKHLIKRSLFSQHICKTSTLYLLLNKANN